MCSLSKEQSILSRETIQKAFFSEFCPFFDLNSLSSFKPSFGTHIRCSVFFFFFNPLLKKPLFLRVCTFSLLKTLREKEKLLVTSNFSFSHIVFDLFGKLSAIFIKVKTVVCKLFECGRA